MNLLSYLIVLIPIAILVVTTKYKLWPTVIQNSFLIQKFVYGNDNVTARSTKTFQDFDRLLPNQLSTNSSKSTINLIKPSDNYRKFLWCMLGLQISYLIWGILQEKIMTTGYSITIDKPKPKYYNFNETLELEQRILSSSNINNSNTSVQLIKFHDSQFLVFLNRITAFIVSIIALLYNRPKKTPLYKPSSLDPNRSKPKAPIFEYIYCSISNTLSSWCQYEALKFVNFPTQVLSKSCKVIPVMLMSKFVLNKRHKKTEYLSAFILSIGMFVFLVYQPTNLKHSLKQTSQGSQTFHINQSEASQFELQADEHSNRIAKSNLISGAIILVLYLAFDSFTSNWQQSIFSRYNVTEWQMMAATNFYSILLTLTSLYQLDNLGPALKMVGSSSSLLVDCIAMSIMSSIGQLFVYYTIKQFGSVVFAVMMTLRQFLAIILSCAIYVHPLTTGSVVGLVIVFCVVVVEILRKSKALADKSNKRHPQHIQLKIVN